MKVLFSIITAALISLTAPGAAFGFDLPKVESDKGSPYSFGHHYDYDNAGSNWNHQRAYRHPEQRQHFSRWYYHYGHKRHLYQKQRAYPYKKYGYYPSIGYSRHKAHIYSRHKYVPNKYAPKGYTQRNLIHHRNRVPSHGFNHTRSFNRVRIGR